MHLPCHSEEGRGENRVGIVEGDKKNLYVGTVEKSCMMKQWEVWQSTAQAMSERQERSKFTNVSALKVSVDPATFEKEKNDGKERFAKRRKNKNLGQARMIQRSF